MSLSARAVHAVHARLQELSLHVREQRRGPDGGDAAAIVASRFAAITKDITVLLVGDAGDEDAAAAAAATAAGADGSSSGDLFADVDAVAESLLLGSKPRAPMTLAPTAENVDALVALFDHNLGLDEPNQPVCNWLRSILVPQDVH